jgi:HlyD family type I secretion membrane fusion protein
MTLTISEPSLPTTERPTSPPRLKVSARGPVVAGLAIFALAVGGFGSWAALAPLSSASIAPGVVVVEGSRKTVQHLEGGIIKEILVAEGSTVEAGQVLVRMDGIRPRALYELLQSEYLAALALKARLVAERDDLDHITFSAEVLASKDDPEVKDLIVGESRLFDARRTGLHGQIDILHQRMVQFEQEIKGLEAQRISKTRQRALIQEELKAVQRMYEQGYEKKPRLLALRRANARLAGERGEHIADISRVKQGIGEAELRIIDLQNGFQREVAAEFQAARTRIAELRDRIRAQEDVLRRLDVRAPQAGVVMGLKVHTTDGVITPGMPILDIVPSKEHLIIDAHVNPEDIDVVHPGLTAQVRLTAYKRRSTPTVDGWVTQVSGDRFVDSHSGSAYYLARIELDPPSLAALDDVKLYPGMPAEVMIETGKRTALDYIISPIANGIQRALREQ